MFYSISNRSTKFGFTLVELLVVISIITLLSSIVLSAVNEARAHARDAYRIESIKEFENALELYYDKYGSYPGWYNSNSDEYPGGSNSYCYVMTKLSETGCGGSINLRHDNSASVSNGFLKPLYNEGFFGVSNWNDPLSPELNNGSSGRRLKWNCQYVVPKSERDAGDVQRYALFCRLEKKFSVSQNDAGVNPALFEVQKPYPWLCVTDAADIDTDPQCN